MSVQRRITNWLETHWVNPAYAGWVLLGLTLFFFVAATNTLSGWLYVISGISAALIAIAVWLPLRSLRGLKVSRRTLEPVSAGDLLSVEVLLENTTSQAKTLLAVQDNVPEVLGSPARASLELIAPHQTHAWTYTYPTERRGVYRWQTLQLRTAAPLGLFWCRRSREVKATAIVYPRVLPLNRCPLVDDLGRDRSLQLHSDQRAQTATEGLTRSLRPYRWGDPIRLVHWRTSARYGELRVRELEVFTGGQDIVLCLDSSGTWDPDIFEEAVTAAASLYFYAKRCALSPKLWTAGSGLVWGDRTVLSTLAAVTLGEPMTSDRPPDSPVIWLSQDPRTLSALPPGSRWVLWPPTDDLRRYPLDPHHPGLVLSADQPLQSQLQTQLNRY